MAVGAGEFDLLPENAAEAGLVWNGPPAVRREAVEVDGRLVSALIWGEAPASIVFLHGGGQNAHTWDTVLLTLLATDPGLGAVAIDLPGHGHSDWRSDSSYTPSANADTLVPVIGRLASGPVTVVGMSLGGLTALRLGSIASDLVHGLVIVDVSPASPARHKSMAATDRGTVALIDGPAVYDSLDEMMDAAVSAAPRRSRSSLRRGVLHNARETDDGRWAWRYDPHRATADTSSLWDDLSSSRIPITLVRGGLSQFVTDADAAEFAHRAPSARQIVVADAGHSVQSDAPAQLSTIIRDALRAAH
jgi:esterase